MALNATILSALRILKPDSLKNMNLVFFEFLKYDNDDLRSENIILKKDLAQRFFDSKRNNKKIPITKIKKEFDSFCKLLTKLNLIEDGDDFVESIKWEKISEICSILRKIESSDEKKLRWAVLHLISDNAKITIDDIHSLLDDFDSNKISRVVQKILKIESKSGLDATFEDGELKFNTDENMAMHYFGDAIEEKSRRSPGEIEQEILELLDEGSYSNQEISLILELDEAIVSRVMTKLRNQNKLVLSSFGDKGFRYYSTNCQNCPFGKTYSSCRKDAISYIVNSFNESYGIDLTSQDFESIESNQSLLAIKRIMKMSKKITLTKLESNMYENFEELLQRTVKGLISTTGKSKKSKEMIVSPNISKLPKMFQLGLKVGIDYEIQLINEIIHKNSRLDPTSVFPLILKDSNKLLKMISDSK
jgi:hypothetical protein